MKSKAWLKRNSKDLFVKEAKAKGYLSRGAFKLLEIDQKYKFISKSNNILELGSAPGGWTQLIFEINPNALIYAFDLLDMKYTNKNLHFIKKSLF